MFWIFFKVRSTAGGIKLKSLLRSKSFNFLNKYFLGFFYFSFAFSLVKHEKDPFFARGGLFSVLLFFSKFFMGGFYLGGLIFILRLVR